MYALVKPLLGIDNSLQPNICIAMLKHFGFSNLHIKKIQKEKKLIKYADIKFSADEPIPIVTFIRCAQMM